jgi:hypothetical protein
MHVGGHPAPPKSGTPLREGGPSLRRADGQDARPQTIQAKS